MAVSTSFLVSSLLFLSLGLTSANRVLTAARTEFPGENMQSEPKMQADFGRPGVKGMPLNAVGSNAGCNFGCNTGCQSCGGNSGCQSCGGNSGCQSCGGSFGCQSCGNFGCQSCGNFGCGSCFSQPPCQWQGSPSCGCSSCMQSVEAEPESTPSNQIKA